MILVEFGTNPDDIILHHLAQIFSMGAAKLDSIH